MASRIMVVEDESIVALNLKQRLIRLGYDVPCIAASHDQAIRGAEETQPDLVLMDINISGDIDGIDTAAKIRTPVIYLTAYSEEKTLERARATHPFGYLVKPFSERELHATIQMALERHQVELRLINSEQQLALAYAQMEEGRREIEIKAGELFQQKERLLVTLNSIGDGVITTDIHGKVTYLNPVAENMTGWSLADACGQSISQVLVLQDEASGKTVTSPVEHVIRHSEITALTDNTVLISKQGNSYAIEDSAAPIRNREGILIGVVLVFHDVSDTRRLAAEVTYQATHDALTGLVNRREFERRLEKAIESAAQSEQRHSLAYLDLDQFKIVNDTCGHVAGDELLRQITGLLRLALRANDTLARLGGDEFGVLLESCPPSVATHISETLRNIIGDFHFVWDERTFPISVSIGLVGFGGRGPEADMSLSEILSIADSACYAAKDAGRNRIHIYRHDDQTLRQRHGEMDWHGRLHRALAQDLFVLHAQAIAPLQHRQNGQHAEILLRLEEEPGKLIPPMAFLPAAERYGLMPEIDRWVIRKSFEHLAAHPPAGDSMFGINLSGTTINDKGALSFISEQLVQSGVTPEQICFEITETSAISNLMNANAMIVSLRNKGCKFALDDFGSGMSSFAYLKHLPVDFLKIDGSFVRDMDENTVDAALVSAINDIAHVMDIETIAEFAENEEILEKLRSSGVDYAQGYGIARPIPLPEFLEKNHSPVPR